jgi:hypothetical protein
VIGVHYKIQPKTLVRVRVEDGVIAILCRNEDCRAADVTQNEAEKEGDPEGV